VKSYLACICVYHLLANKDYNGMVCGTSGKASRGNLQTPCLQANLKFTSGYKVVPILSLAS